MKPVAFIVAVIAAVVGAAIWGGITAATGMEIGLVAWGIGILVGAGARIAGGYGSGCGVVCAILALCAILAGKALTVQLMLPYEIERQRAEIFPDEMYKTLMTSGRSTPTRKSPSSWSRTGTVCLTPRPLSPKKSAGISKRTLRPSSESSIRSVPRWRNGESRFLKPLRKNTWPSIHFSTASRTASGRGISFSFFSESYLLTKWDRPGRYRDRNRF